MKLKTKKLKGCSESRIIDAIMICYQAGVSQLSLALNLHKHIGMMIQPINRLTALLATLFFFTIHHCLSTAHQYLVTIHQSSSKVACHSSKHVKTCSSKLTSLSIGSSKNKCPAFWLQNSELFIVQKLLSSAMELQK